jgi:hypothetical protein
MEEKSYSARKPFDFARLSFLIEPPLAFGGATCADDADRAALIRVRDNQEPLGGRYADRDEAVLELRVTGIGIPEPRPGP